MSAPITRFARPQIKAVLRERARTYIASEWGLYELDNGTLKGIAAWQGQPVQCIASASDGFLLMTEDDSGQTLHACDSAWHATGQIPVMPGEKIKALCALDAGVLVGTKSGVFRFDAGRWTRLFGDAHGHGEVLWVRSTDGQRITASVKKTGPGARPALIETADGGQTWGVLPSPDYQDTVLAANGQWIVTRWKGARRRGERGETKKHPLSAAAVWEDGWAVLDGDKLETHHGQGHAGSSFYHPMLAEAEQLHLLADRVLVAGVQGAFLVDPARGTVTDLFDGMELPSELGKIKRIFVLDEGVLVTTATFGTFRSTDGGVHWQPVDAEWNVLDAEHLLKGPDGQWWLACQRALFVSPDNGQSWRYVKLKVKGAHYSELRGGIAIVNQRLFVGTKAGLLSSALSRPDAVEYVPAFEGQSIEALHGDGPHGELIVGTATGELWRYRVDGASARKVADAEVYESVVMGTPSHFVFVSGNRVFDVQESVMREIKPGAGNGEFSLARGDADTFVLWNSTHAWQGRVGSELVPLAHWPVGIRHASLGEGAKLIHTTDRRTLRHLSLTAA
ncbi:MAG: hypothetical protein Q8N13_16045 [Acidovorax sp.]|nr:hypothetical protein [Acidovorax sp.]